MAPSLRSNFLQDSPSVTAGQFRRVRPRWRLLHRAGLDADYDVVAAGEEERLALQVDEEERAFAKGLIV